MIFVSFVWSMQPFLTQPSISFSVGSCVWQRLHGRANANALRYRNGMWSPCSFSYRRQAWPEAIVDHHSNSAVCVICCSVVYPHLHLVSSSALSAWLFLLGMLHRVSVVNISVTIISYSCKIRLLGTYREIIGMDSGNHFPFCCSFRSRAFVKCIA